jgi:pentatricopeptide repeat protein
VQDVLANVSASFKPRLPGLTKLMARFCKQGDWQKSLSIYDSLPLLDVLPDTTITNAAIAACDKGGQWLCAKVIFDSMESRSLTKDTITYSSTISALSKSKQATLPISV